MFVNQIIILLFYTYVMFVVFGGYRYKIKSTMYTICCGAPLKPLSTKAIYFPHRHSYKMRYIRARIKTVWIFLNVRCKVEKITAEADKPLKWDLSKDICALLMMVASTILAVLSAGGLSASEYDDSGLQEWNLKQKQMQCKLIFRHLLFWLSLVCHSCLLSSCERASQSWQISQLASEHIHELLDYGLQFWINYCCLSWNFSAALFINLLHYVLMLLNVFIATSVSSQIKQNPNCAFQWQATGGKLTFSDGILTLHWVCRYPSESWDLHPEATLGSEASCFWTNGKCVPSFSWKWSPKAVDSPEGSLAVHSQGSRTSWFWRSRTAHFACSTPASEHVSDSERRNLRTQCPWQGFPWQKKDKWRISERMKLQKAVQVK